MFIGIFRKMKSNEPLHLRWKPVGGCICALLTRDESRRSKSLPSMRNALGLLVPTLVIALTACRSLKPDDFSQPQAQMNKQFKFYKTQNLKINYLLFLPADYEAKSGKRWPLILFLHGAGE